MRSKLVVLSLAFAGAGCGFHAQAVPPDGSDLPSVDAAAAIDTPPVGCHTFSSQLDTCALAPTGDLTLSGDNPTDVNTYDTSTHELKFNGASRPVMHMMFPTADGTIDVIIARDVHLNMRARLRATGGVPLAIVATGKITLDQGAVIDVGIGGAGALTACSTQADAGIDNPGGGAGGGGGGYGDAGGKGSDGNHDGTQTKGGAGAGSISVPTGVQGGCAGARGGNGDSPGGPAGLGGGGLYLVAGDRIELGNGAMLLANGGGGHGGNQGGAPPSGDSGGGGGSGGLIFLESPRVTTSQAQIAANGGGGGEGSNSAVAGRSGEDGRPANTRADGGAGLVTDGGDGARGGAGGTATGDDAAQQQSNGGGGGGGGGVGYIRIVSAQAQLGTMSPAPIRL